MMLDGLGKHREQRPEHTGGDPTDKAHRHDENLWRSIPYLL
jgi:hypothetical protein